MITFLINYHSESPDIVDYQVEKLAGFYGGTPIILCDGVEFKGKTPSVFLPQLKTKANGGSWTHRYLDYFLKNSTDNYLIKIDPDTEILNKITDLPKEDCIFCRVVEHKFGDSLFRVPAGGALGFTRNITKKIVEGEYFLNDRYKNNVRFNNYNDLMLMDIIKVHNLLMVDRPDFCCGNRPKTPITTFFHR